MQEDGKATVLVISDDGKALLGVARLVARMIPHHVVRVCSEGAHALHYMSYTPVKGIILRYEQAPLDAIALANILIERRPNVPIILLCDQPTCEVINAAYAVGCHAVLDSASDIPMLQSILYKLFAAPSYLHCNTPSAD